MVRGNCSRKQDNKKSIGPLFILGFALICFSLLTIDVANRFHSAAIGRKSQYIVVTQAAALSNEKEHSIDAQKPGFAEPTQEELEKLIMENFSGESGG